MGGNTHAGLTAAERAEVLRFWAALELFASPDFSEVSTERSVLCRWTKGANDARQKEARAFWSDAVWPQGDVTFDTGALRREELRNVVPYFTVQLGVVSLRSLFSHILRALEVPLSDERTVEDLLGLYQPGGARRRTVERPEVRSVLMEAANLRGTTFLASFDLNPWGKVVPGSFSVSGVVAALSLALERRRKIRALRARNEPVPPEWLKRPFDLEEAEERRGWYASHFERHAAETLGTDAHARGFSHREEKRVITLSDPQDGARAATAEFIEYVTERIGRWIGWSGTMESSVRVTKHNVWWTPRSEDRVMLGSFHWSDLMGLLERAEVEEPLGAPLETLFEEILKPADRHDLLTDPKVVETALHPALFPRGRWPSNASHHLYAAQQAAVNLICRPLRSASEGSKEAEALDAARALGGDTLLSLNGPPGTGKSWLLRDVVADIVTKRAVGLAQLERSADVFAADRSVRFSAEGKERRFTPVRGDLTAEHLIVVASNNNAAIRNITDTLPRSFGLERVATDPQTGRMRRVGGFDYWKSTAERMLWNAVSEAERREAKSAPKIGAPEPGTRAVWGLVSATLGRRSNCRRFALDVLTPSKVEEKSTEVREDGRPDAFATEAAKIPERDASDVSIPTLLREEAAFMAFSGVDPEANWRRAREAFLEAHARVEARIAKFAASDMRPSLFETSFADAPEQHKTSLWVDEAFERDRSELFLAALSLHAATLAAQAETFAGVFETLGAYFRSPSPVFEEGEPIDVFRTLSLLVPVVSTTLASAGRLFAECPPESIGWLIVDEASQATPQSAAGLLSRAKRAVVLGDPRQLMPVVTTPEVLVDYLRVRLAKTRPADALWGPLASSLQTLSDRTMRTGAAIEDSGTGVSVWTGLPLRTHRRCGSPMFEIANAVSYANQMVQMTPRTDDGLASLSRWIDVVPRERPETSEGAVPAFAGKRDAKVVPEEIECMRRVLLSLESDRARRMTSVFVVSPFRSVADAAQSEIRKLQLRRIEARADTVHAFQGQEADVVLLLLGSAPGEAGKRQRRWAASPANLVNVAVTRARRDLVVIGSLKDWSAERTFDLVAAHLPCEEADAGSLSTPVEPTPAVHVPEADLFEEGFEAAPPDLPPAPPVESWADEGWETDSGFDAFDVGSPGKASKALSKAD